MKKYTCIICPNGCDIITEIQDGKVFGISGNKCERGAEYVRSEVTNPMRTITTSVKVNNGDFPIVPVRLTKPIPKASIFEAISILKNVTLDAPLMVGDSVIKNICGYDSDVIITKNVSKI